MPLVEARAAPLTLTELTALLSVAVTVYVTVWLWDEVVNETVLSLTLKVLILGLCVSDLVTVTFKVEVVEFPAVSVDVAVNVTVVFPQL